MVKNSRILVVVTSAGEYEKVGYRTGLWLGEFTHFYDVVVQAGFEVRVASTDGGAVPLDPESLTSGMLADHGTGERYLDRDFMDMLSTTPSLADVDSADYDAIYLTGGHGTMFDFPRNERLAGLVREFADAGKIVAAVCHGVSGLLPVRVSGGEYLVAGKDVTGFSWHEEELAQRVDAVPFNLQEELAKRGGRYSAAQKPFDSFVVEDGLLITGQNPASATAVAEAVVNRLG